MPIQFRCHSCNQLLSIGTKMAGRELTCPKCKSQLTVPQPEPSVEAEKPALQADSSPQSEPTASEKSPEMATSAEQENQASEPQQPTETTAETKTAAKPKSKRKARSEDDAKERRRKRRRRLRRKRREEEEEQSFQLSRIADEEEMDLTPMVDVTFLLLIFFMITASFQVQQSIPTPVPDPDSDGASTNVVEELEVQDEALIVEITETEQIYVNDQLIDEVDSLAFRLEEARGLNGGSHVIIKSSSKARHGIVVEAMDAANIAGMQRIQLATLD